MNDTKEHILEISLSLFLQKNFKAVTMKEIVNKTDLSKGAFYHYFESKEQLFEEVVKHYYGKLLSHNYQNKSNAPHESLKDYYNNFIDEAYQTLNYFREIGKITKQKGEEGGAKHKVNHFLLLFDAIEYIPGFDERKKEQDEKEYQSWKEMITVAKENGEIREDISTERIAQMFMYSGDGYGINVIWQNWEGKEQTTFEALRAIWDELYNLIRCDS